MRPDELKDLVAVADSRKQQAEARMAQICKRERQLRAMLKEMADQFQTGLTHASDSMFSMRGLGAHQAWVDFARRRRAALNRDLALVMAEKLDCSAELRRHLGRSDALGTLQSEAARQQRRAREARDQERILDAYLHRDLSV